jgi:hypothetical protein
MPCFLFHLVLFCSWQVWLWISYWFPESHKFNSLMMVSYICFIHQVRSRPFHYIHASLKLKFSLGLKPSSLYKNMFKMLFSITKSEVAPLSETWKHFLKNLLLILGDQSEPVPTSALSTGCLLWLRCGWISTELLSGFTYCNPFSKKCVLLIGS